MTVVLLSRDLMLQSRAEGAARSEGATLVNANDVAQALEKSSDEQCSGLVVDLRFPNLDIKELLSKIRTARGTSFFVVACGPHVHEASLSAAREAGCDLVATRGQFERDAEHILRQCSGNTNS